MINRMVVSPTKNMVMDRKWGMPSSDTFDCPTIGAFVKRYLYHSDVSIDPFARNKQWATHTNDLNKDTNAEYHIKALDFLQMLLDEGARADLIIFDPPYSTRQIKECYEGIGEKMQYDDTINLWQKEKRLCNKLLPIGGVFLCFGWNSIGMGAKRGFKFVEILLVSHGRGHNDTICTAEKKAQEQQVLFRQTGAAR